VQNLHTHIHLAEGAQLQHLRLALPQAQDRMAQHVHARLAQGARYQQALVATGAAYHLQRTVVQLQGANAQARTAALLLPAGQVLEQQVHTRLDAAHTAAHTEVLALAADHERVVANAHSRIAPGAHEAQVRQRLSGVALNGQPRMVLRPHLEILHDQVQAAHGATWGRLPEDALFYARSAGWTKRKPAPSSPTWPAPCWSVRSMTTPAPRPWPSGWTAACWRRPWHANCKRRCPMGESPTTLAPSPTLAPARRRCARSSRCCSKHPRRAAGLSGQRRHHADAAGGAGRHAPLRRATAPTSTAACTR
jgi:hypothetical protein